MEINSSTMVGEIVRKNFKTAQLFDKKGIDFCCGGAVSLEQACADSNVELNEIDSRIKVVNNSISVLASNLMKFEDTADI